MQESGQALQVSKMMLLTCSADALEGSPPGSARGSLEQAQQVGFVSRTVVGHRCLTPGVSPLNKMRPGQWYAVRQILKNESDARSSVYTGMPCFGGVLFS